MIYPRKVTKQIKRSFNHIPVTAITGARQTGKSTLAKVLLNDKTDVVFIDLESLSDLSMLEDPEAFLNFNKTKIICIDEIQIKPELFSSIRYFVDQNPKSKLLILGSSSPDLIRQGSESLAGRIFYYELSTFLLNELDSNTKIETYRLRGGFPSSILAKDDAFAFEWLNNYIKTFLERDLLNFGYRIAPQTISRLWKMLAHYNGQVINYSIFANSLGVSQPTIKSYIDILQQTYMLRLVEPYHINIKKRLVKSPKIYFRDTGILHCLLNISSYEMLYTHPIYGSSWEVTVIENIINNFSSWSPCFYRTAKGNEIDLVLIKNDNIWAIEIKSSTAPKLGKGFYIGRDDIKATRSFVIAPVKMPFPMKNDVMAYPLLDFINEFANE